MTGLFIGLLLTLGGCWKSKGQFVATDTATTPLPEGQYYEVILNDSNGTPDLSGTVSLKIQGNGYVSGDKGIHLIKLRDDVPAYIAQVDSDDADGTRPVFLALVRQNGLCMKAVRSMPTPALNGDIIVSKPLFLQWLTEHADIALTAPNFVCLVMIYNEPTQSAGTPSGPP